MRTITKTSAYLARLERLAARMHKLENRAAVSSIEVIYCEVVKRLPKEYKGERHEVLTKRLGKDKNGHQCGELEERPGPDPNHWVEPGPGQFVSQIIARAVDPEPRFCPSRKKEH